MSQVLIKTLLEKTSMYDLPDLPHVADVSMNIGKLQSFGITAEKYRRSFERNTGMNKPSFSERLLFRKRNWVCNEANN